MLRFFKDADDDSGAESGLALSSVVSDSPATDSDAGQVILRTHIDRALETLSPREKVAFVLRHIHDHSLKEIAENMAVAEGTVKSLIFRAKRKMQKELKGLKPEVLNHAG